MQLIEGRPVYAATDLVGFLACSHRLALERAALAGLVERPIRNDPSVELIAERGLAHERRYLEELRAEGRSIVEIPKARAEGPVTRATLESEAEATVAAMRAGAEVIYQATFFDGTWVGYADFLLRVDRPSDLGAWSYEVADTKLARRTKASAILQICSYVDQLTRVQGLEPVELHVVLGGSQRQRDVHRVADYMAYYRRVKAEFEAAVAAGEAVYPVTATYPEPVEHCDVCRWAVHCRDQRRRDDDLSRVAGISARQRRALKDRGIRRRRELAVLDLPMTPRLERVSAESLERVREQARIQVEGEDAGEPRWELLDPERDDDGALIRDRGLLTLPEPSPNDLFFDIEGDPFALDDGVEYLFGVLEPARPDPTTGEPAFHEVWSRDAAGDVTLAAEKRAFEVLVDLVMDRLDADPSMHVYHYAAYERAALSRLAQRHSTRVDEVDRLLRGGVLVDLYRAVRQGVRASVESYSIKRLEPLYGLERAVDLRSAGSSIVAFEAWLEGGTTENGQVGEAILREIAGYNRDDVLSNLRLRDWLEDRRLDLQRRLGGPVPRPSLEPDAAPSVELTARDRRAAELAERLAGTLPEAPEDRTPEEAATWLLAQLLGWHRREEKAFWWRYFDLCRMRDEELVDQREPLGAIERISVSAPSRYGTVVERYRFPPQDHGLRVGTTVDDPGSKSTVGEVAAIDDVARTVDLKRTKSQLDPAVPTSLIPKEFFGSDAQEDSLARIAEWVAELGINGEGPFRAGRDLLLRRAPDMAAGAGAPLRLAGEDALTAGRRIVGSVPPGMLAIQGPPGSGKTYTAAGMILTLVRRGRRVGVSANSHKVIGHLLDELREAAAKSDALNAIRIGQKPGQGEKPTSPWARALGEAADVVVALRDGTVNVVGGTAWLWSRPELAGAVDVLFVDEAGQLALANAVAVSPAAGTIVLLGDPQQLEQPLKGSHPPGAERSALGHVLDGRPTIPPDLGLFLEHTWRLHPDLCAYTSETFYANELEPEPTLATQALEGRGLADGTGVRWLPVAHAGNAVEAREEAVAITALVRELLSSSPTWTDRFGTTRAITLADVVIVAPYNAHVELIGETLAAAGLRDARVGTVDKFQGQEAPISIYSMATSSPEEAPRGMEFLYSRNRLNVATSRARCVAIVVASPALIRVQCHTPRQMRLANALCRLVERADAGAPTDPDHGGMQAREPDGAEVVGALR